MIHKDIWLMTALFGVFMLAAILMGHFIVNALTITLSCVIKYLKRWF